jgi:hypothetical protein
MNKRKQEEERSSNIISLHEGIRERYKLRHARPEAAERLRE